MSENAQATLPCGSVLCDVKNNKWIIQSFTGISGPIESYAAALHNEKVAMEYSATIKVEPHHIGGMSKCMQFFMKHATSKAINKWADVKKIKNKPQLLQLIGSGTYTHKRKKYNFIVLIHYDTDIKELFLESGQKLPASTVYKAALQILPVLQYIHSTAHVHADIKGENLLVNLKSEGHVYLTISHLLLNYYTRNYYVKPTAAHYGNLKYSSRDHHLGVPSMRGDLEMLLFNMVQWLCNSLPWDNINHPVVVQQMKEMAFKDTKKFLQNCFKTSEISGPIKAFMSLLATEDRYKEPQYNKFSSILKKGLKQLGYNITGGLYSKANNVFQTEIPSNQETSEPNKTSSAEKKTSQDLPDAKAPNHGIERLNYNDLETISLQSRLTSTNDPNGSASLSKDMREAMSRLKSLRSSNKRKMEEIKEKTLSRKPKKTKLANEQTEQTEQLDELNLSNGGDDDNPSQVRSISLNMSLNAFDHTNQSVRSPALSKSNGLPIPPASSNGFDSQNGSQSENLSHLRKPEELAQDKFLHIWLGMLDKILGTFSPISLEPHTSDDQVQEVLVIREQFRREQFRLDDLENELAKLPANSAHVANINGIIRLWQNQLCRLEERGQKLSDAYLRHLDSVLKVAQDKLKRLSLDRDSRDHLQREMEILSELLKGKRTLLANAKTMTDQLCRTFNDSSINSNLRVEAQYIDKFFHDIQQKIAVKTVEMGRSFNDRRQFDDVYLWLDDELNAVNEQLLVSTDCAALRQQLQRCQAIYQRVIGRKNEVTKLLDNGRESLARSSNLENQTIQQRYLDSMQSKWNRLMHGLAIREKLKACLEHGDSYYDTLDRFLVWLSKAENKLKNLKLVSFKHENDLKKHQNELTLFANEVRRNLNASKNCTSLGVAFVRSCDKDEDDAVKSELDAMTDRWEKLNAGLLQRIQSIEGTLWQFTNLNEHLQRLKNMLRQCESGVTVSSDVLGGTVAELTLLERIKKLREKTAYLQEQLDELRRQATGLARRQDIDISYFLEEIDCVTLRIARLKADLDDNRSQILEQQEEINVTESDVNLMQKQTEDKFPVLLPLKTDWPSVELIDLTNDDKSDEEGDCAADAPDVQQHLESRLQQENRLDKHAEAHVNELNQTSASDKQSMKTNAPKEKSNEKCAKSSEVVKQNTERVSRLTYDLNVVYQSLVNSTTGENLEREPRQEKREENPFSTDGKDEEV